MVRIYERIYHKYCHYCGKIYFRPRLPSGYLQCMTDWNKRKYCSKTCSGKAAPRSTFKENASRSAYGKRVYKYRDYKCAECGSTKHVCIHHKDGNWKNNDPSNLETLCNSCHTKLHHKRGDIIQRPKTYCKICGKIAVSYGYCKKHYNRFKSHGHPLMYLKQIKSSGGKGNVYDLVMETFNTESLVKINLSSEALVSTSGKT